MAIIGRRVATLTHRLSCTTASGASRSSSSITAKVPLLYTFSNNDANADPTHQNDAATLQLLSWGRGASGQLGGGIEEIRLYPAPVANLVVPKSSFALSQTPGRLPSKPAADGFGGGGNSKKVVEVGISCGLFHSSLIVDGALWVWGKGDGGRLGFGHENPLFVPALNPHLDNVRCVALGGLHSVALTSTGEVFTWSEPLQLCLSLVPFWLDMLLVFVSVLV